MLRFSRHALVLAPLLGLATVALLPADARACGGCFHSPPPPEQPAQDTSVVTDHRMVLSLGTSSTTLWDQIQYAGDPNDFAWVLPTQGPVKVGIGTNAFIDALDQRTAPVVHAPKIVCLPPPGGGFGSGNGGCQIGCGSSSSSDSAGTAYDSQDSGAAPDTGVVVTSKSTVGPYDVVQIHGTDEGAIVGWLRAHAYVIPKDIEPMLTQYVTEGFDFVAVRLSPGKGVQAMKPIRVTFQGRYPTLPLRMVAAGVGATVGVKLFVIGDGRWRAKNFETFTVDPLTLTWDFAAARSDYTDQRAAIEAKFPNGAFGLESSIDMDGSGIPMSDPLAPDAGVPAFDTGAFDTASDDVGADTASDAADATEAAADTAIDDAADTATDDGGFDASDGAATDAQLAFGTYGKRRVTRLRADLPAAALAIDLQLEADETQAVLPADMLLVKYKNETSVCPSGVQPASAPGSLLGPSAAAACNTGGSGPSPARSSLVVALGAIVVSIGRRALRRSTTKVAGRSRKPG